MRRGRMAATAALATAAALVSGGCGSALVPRAAAAEFDTYPACDALLGRIHEVAAEHVGPYGLDVDPYIATDRVAVPDVVPVPTTAYRAAPSPRDPATESPQRVDAGAADPTAATTAPAPAASGTNVQEAGVDEDDSVKTAPGRILVLESAVLRYVDVTDGSPRLRGSLALGFDATGLLVAGDHVLAVGSDTDNGPGTPRVVVTEVDVSDPDALHAGKSVRVDGTLAAARSNGDIARIVVESEPDISFVQPGPGSRGEDRATDANRAVVTSTTIADWLPRVDGGPGVDCTRVMVPHDYAGAGMLTVMTLGIGESLRIRDTTALMARGETVYDSGSTMYVAMAGPARRTGLVDAEGEASTAVHAFDVSGADPATYVASGRVAGRIQDRWAMSEARGILRVVVAGDGFAGSSSSSSLVTLRREGSALVEAGRVDGIGRGEQVKAVRFVGDRGYVVTFKRTDPLWVLDLRDAASPRISGALHVPGYSAYLHPIGDGTLVGVGQDADEATGLPLGLKVAVYDVSDPARPATTAEWHAAPGTNSTAEEDPHAFLWWAPTGTVAIPVRAGVTPTRTGVTPTWADVTSPPPPRPEVDPSVPDAAQVPPTPAAETVVLHAGPSSLAESGRISCAGGGRLGSGGDDHRRSVVAGDSIFTVCDGGVAGFRLDGFASTGEAAWS